MTERPLQLNDKTQSKTPIYSVTQIKTANIDLRERPGH